MLRFGYIMILSVTLISLCARYVYGDMEDEAWIDPHAWGHLHDWNSNDATDICNQCTASMGGVSGAVSAGDTVALVYFKKFLKNLFGRQMLEYDEYESLYKRTIYFQLLPAQLDELEKIRDPRDLDIVLTAIFENAHTLKQHQHHQHKSKEGGGVLSLVWEISKDFFQLLKISEVQFALMVVTSMALGWLVHRKYRVRLIAVVLGGFVLFGYLITYLECNRKLEVDQMIEILESHEANVNIENLPWYSRLKNYVFSIDPVAMEQKTKIRKVRKLELPFCRPDHVLLMYANELFVKQLEFLFEKCSATIASLKSGLPFPYNYLAPLILICMLGYILKLTFKYILSPKAWAALLHGPPGGNQQTSPHAYNGHNAASIAESTEDRLSGENLKMLLNVIHSAASTSSLISKQQQQQLPAVSGVQEVLETLEAPTVNESKSSSSSPDTTDSSITEEDNSKLNVNNNMETVVNTSNNNDDNEDVTSSIQMKVSEIGNEASL